jgi:6-pyruvoyl-tetrahydropterin synthase
MFAVEVRDHIMIAHSLPHPFFGPAQALHGATFVVDLAFFRAELDPHGVVVDIGKAHEVLKAVLGDLTYRNLDEVPALAGRLTTTEFLCRHIFDRVAEACRAGAFGPDRGGVDKLRVTLHESHVARAWFEGPVG